MLRKTFSFLKSLFLSGLFTILPIAFTLFFINFLYNFTYRLIEPLHQMEPAFLLKIPGSEFILATILIILLGVALKVFIAHSMIRYFERVIAKIPLVRMVYSSVKTVVDFFQHPERTPKSHTVVLIHYPRKGNFHLAFLLESAEKDYQRLIPDEEKKAPNEKYFKVFMPKMGLKTEEYFITENLHLIYSQN